MKAPETWDPPKIDPEIVLKYDRPGPRYTSYPTAPHFHERFTCEDRIRAIRRSNEIAPPAPLSLYFHIPFCSSLCRFCGCSVHRTKDRGISESYVDALLAELSSLGNLLGKGRKLEQLHWGGGTPTFIPAGLLGKLHDAVFDSFETGTSPEIGIELDPRELGESHFEFLERSRFNRFSIGIQDFDPRVQEAVHRAQDEKATVSVFERLRKLDRASLSVDLMYGLPLQTARSFSSTIGKVIGMAPDRVAVFNFAYIPEQLPHQRTIDAGLLPSPAEKLEILGMVIGELTSAGYVCIGMDHFARPGDELAAALKEGTLHRNFQGYTTKGGCDLFGVGATSISQFSNVYSQNIKDAPRYIEAAVSGRSTVMRGIELTGEDLLRRDVINGLMCRSEVRKNEIEEKHGIEFDMFFKDELENLAPMEKDGLVSLSRYKLEVKPLGRLLVRNIAMVFDAYLNRAGCKATFSRTV